MRDVFHRIGALEAHTEALRTAVATHEIADTRSHDDHEVRLRSLEHLTAKVVGGAIVGAAVGGWILNQLANLFQ